MNFLYKKLGLGVGGEKVTGEIDSGRVQYIGGHKAFPKPVYIYISLMTGLNLNATVELGGGML